MRRETIYIPAVSNENNFCLNSDEESSVGGGDGAMGGAGLTADDLDQLEHLNVVGNVQVNNYERSPKVDTFKETLLEKGRIFGAHCGLVGLLISYLLIGATVFHYIEAPNEILVKDREISTILSLRDTFHENIWNLTHSTDTVISQESFNAIGQEYFEQLVTNIFSAYRNQFINERHLLNRTSGDEMLWTYSNSVFFATTVVTTIGYGNLVPTTKVGRIVCICFGLFGIPLLLVTIADMGKFLITLFTFFCRRYAEFKRKLRQQSRRLSHYSRHTRNHDRHRSGDSSSPHLSTSRQSSFAGDGDTTTAASSPKAGSMNLNDVLEQRGAEDEEMMLEENPRIPVYLVFLMLVAYTALGGFIFQQCEEWPYLEAFYFCFITMTTVGFGDIVPSEKVHIFFIMVYVIFGLSLTTMCIDLAGTQYLKKIHYLGRKMGNARGVVITGFQVGKHTGMEVFRTAGGQWKQVVLRSKQNQQYQKNNMLYEPPTATVLKLVKQRNIKILPDDISERDGYVMQNKGYDKPTLKKFMLVKSSPNVIYRHLTPAKRRQTTVLVPFVLKESDI